MPEFVTELYYGRVVITAGAADMETVKDLAKQIRELLPRQKNGASVYAQWVHYRNGEETVEQSQLI